jgi:hypothetical protein
MSVAQAVQVRIAMTALIRNCIISSPLSVYRGLRPKNCLVSRLLFFRLYQLIYGVFNDAVNAQAMVEPLFYACEGTE